MKDKLPHEKGFHVSWDQIHRDSRALAWRLENKGPENGHWKGLIAITRGGICLLYTSPSPRDATLSRMPSSA